MECLTLKGKLKALPMTMLTVNDGKKKSSLNTENIKNAITSQIWNRMFHKTFKILKSINKIIELKNRMILLFCVYQYQNYLSN